VILVVARLKNMKLPEALYQWLATLPDSEADQVLATGLEHADPPQFAARIIATMLERKTELSWAGLAANYDRLQPADRVRLRGVPEELLRAGIARALQSPTARHRQNALAMLIEDPQPQLVLLLSDALRDVLPTIREAAAKVLRASAEKLLHQSEQEGEASEVGAASTELRTTVVEALREALRSFDTHFRLEVLEAGLWFARELHDTLENILGTRRSHAAYAVTEQLAAWDHPRLAGFLLAALTWSGWRRTAQEVLERWNSAEHLSAILKHSDLLDDPQLRENLNLVKTPPWLGAAGADLAGLRPTLRELVPRWLCCLGYSDDERVRILARWRLSRFPEVQRAAVHALATLDHPDALRIVADVAMQPGPLMEFARQHLAERRAAVSSRDRAGGGRTPTTETDACRTSP
jgi:hypothetical protein